MAEIEFVLHGVDTSVGTFLAWESAHRAPEFAVIARDRIEEVSGRLSRSLPGDLRGGDAAGTAPASAGPGALTAGPPSRLGPAELYGLLPLMRGALVDPGAHRLLMGDLASTLHVVPFIEALRQEVFSAPDGDRVLLAVNPPPSCGQVPWELLPTGGTTDDGYEEVLLDLVDIVTMAPVLTRDSRSDVPHPQWRPGPGVYLIQPWGRAGDPHVGMATTVGGQAVLPAASLRSWDDQVAQLEDGSIAPEGGRADRIWLSEVLRTGGVPGDDERPGCRGTEMPTRLLYVGHMDGSGSSSRLRLDDAEDVFGLMEVDAAGVRWFSAADLYKGTTSWREEKFRHLVLALQRSNDRGADDTAPVCARPREGESGEVLGWRFPACVQVTGSGDEEQVTPMPGGALWPMPPRVGLVACASGGETRSVEPFGLATSCLEAGAELVFATRWTMLTDAAFARMGLIRPPHTTRHPFDELAHTVDGLLQADDPVHEMSEWKRLRLADWRADPGDVGNAPISWAGLTAFRAPDRSAGEPTIP